MEPKTLEAYLFMVLNYTVLQTTTSNNCHLSKRQYWSLYLFYLYCNIYNFIFRLIKMYTFRLDFTESKPLSRTTPLANTQHMWNFNDARSCVCFKILSWICSNPCVFLDMPKVKRGIQTKNSNPPQKKTKKKP